MAQKARQPGRTQNNALVALSNNGVMVHTKISLVICIIVSIAAHLLVIAEFGIGFRSSEEARRSSLRPTSLPLSVLTIGRVGANVNVQADIVGARASKSVSFQQQDTSSTPDVNLRASIGDAPLILPLIDNYLPISQLTVAPSPVGSIDPTPLGLRLDGLVGEAELILLVSSDGAIDEVLIVRSSLPEFLVDYAKSVFRDARFKPGQVNEIKVRSRIRILLSPNTPPTESDAGVRSSLKNSER